jgi:hypothetical protein
VIIDQPELRRVLGAVNVRPILDPSGALRGYELTATRCKCRAVARNVERGPFDVTLCDLHIDDVARSVATRRWLVRFKSALGELAPSVKTHFVGQAMAASFEYGHRGRSHSIKFDTIKQSPAEAAASVRLVWSTLRAALKLVGSTRHSSK